MNAVGAKWYKHKDKQFCYELRKNGDLLALVERAPDSGCWFWLAPRFTQICCSLDRCPEWAQEPGMPRGLYSDLAKAMKAVRDYLKRHELACKGLGRWKP